MEEELCVSAEVRVRYIPMLAATECLRGATVKLGRRGVTASSPLPVEPPLAPPALKSRSCADTRPKIGLVLVNRPPLARGSKAPPLTRGSKLPGGMPNWGWDIRVSPVPSSEGRIEREEVVKQKKIRSGSGYSIR